MVNNKSICLLVLVITTLFNTANGAVAQHALADIALAELRESANLVGLAAVSYNQQGEKWSHYLGYADKSTKLGVSATTEFRYASVSKFVTTGLLAELVSEGKMDLDKSIYSYIPDYPKKDYDFTVRQLLTHTAGIPHYQGLHDYNIDNRAEPYENVQQGVSLFENRSLLHKPGSEYRYSSFAFNLLSLVIENAGKKPFLNQLSDMTMAVNAPSIKAEKFDEPRVSWSKLYDTAGNSLERGNIGYKWAGGGLVGSASDLAKFGLSLLTDSIIKSATLNQFNTPQKLADGSEIKVSRSSMAVGWRIRENRFGQEFFHHSGSMSGARSHISVFPKENESIVLLSNTQWSVALDDTAASLQMLINSQPEQKCKFNVQTFGNEISRATLTFSQNKEMCIGDIKLGEKLTGTLAGNTAKTTFRMLFTADNKVALVAPIGIFQGTINANSLSLDILDKLYEFPIK